MIVYRFFFEPGVASWPEGGCPSCSFLADQVAHLAHLNARDTTLVFVSRAPQPTNPPTARRGRFRLGDLFSSPADIDVDGTRAMLALPAHARMAPVDSDEFAQFIVECAAGGPGEGRDFAGPQTLTMSELMQQYLVARGQRRRIHRAPLPKRVQAALTARNTSPHTRLGDTTWAEWLQRSDATPPSEAT